MGQLGTKVQHALRAYTPAEQKAAKAAAQSFRENPEFDTYEAITQLATGEALVSTLDEEGIPTVVQKCTILPPQSQMGALDDVIRKDEMINNLLYAKYTQEMDRESAYEILAKKVAAEEEEEAARKAAEKEALALEKQKEKEAAAAEKQKLKEQEAAKKAAEKEAAAKEKRRKSAIKSVASSATGTIGREIGKEIGDSIGGSFGKKIGGNVGASLGRGILSTLFKL